MNDDQVTAVGGLSTVAQQIGAKLARKLFEARGNHSEAHLSEYELTMAIAAGAQVAINAAARVRS